MAARFDAVLELAQERTWRTLLERRLLGQQWFTGASQIVKRHDVSIVGTVSVLSG
jgi:hypothetical protein